MMGGVKAEYDMAANAGAKKQKILLNLIALIMGYRSWTGLSFLLPYFVLNYRAKIGLGPMGNLHSRDKDLKFSNVIDKINSRTITFSLNSRIIIFLLALWLEL